MQIKRKFEVRDISGDYDGPTFDVIFNDGEVQRYSEEVFESRERAYTAIEETYEQQEDPTWWSRCDGQDDDSPMGPTVKRTGVDSGAAALPA